jgi:hypothetical protein
MLRSEFHFAGTRTLDNFEEILLLSLIQPLPKYLAVRGSSSTGGKSWRNSTEPLSP